MVPIYVLDFGSELVNMVVQGFTQAHGTKVLLSNLTNKESVIICGKGPYLTITRSILATLTSKYAKTLKFYVHAGFYEFYAN